MRHLARPAHPDPVGQQGRRARGQAPAGAPSVAPALAPNPLSGLPDVLRRARRTSRAGPLLLVLAIWGSALAGCGYSFTGTLPGHIKSVAVPVFTNKTQEPAVENAITAAVINAFVSSGRLKVVPVEEADSILEGEIVGYQIDSIAFDRRINIREYRLRVTMNLQFRDVRQGAVLWRQEGLEEKADFRVQGQVSDTISREEGAVREAAVDIGRKIVTLAVDRF